MHIFSSYLGVHFLSIFPLPHKMVTSVLVGVLWKVYISPQKVDKDVLSISLSKFYFPEKLKNPEYVELNKNKDVKIF